MVEILHYEPVDKNKVVGYVDLKVSLQKPTDLIFRRIAHLRSEGKSWLNFPSFPRLLSDGTQKYMRYAEFAEPNHNSKFLEAILLDVKKYIDSMHPLSANTIMEFEPLPF